MSTIGCQAINKFLSNWTVIWFGNPYFYILHSFIFSVFLYKTFLLHLFVLMYAFCLFKEYKSLFIISIVCKVFLEGYLTICFLPQFIFVLSFLLCLLICRFLLAFDLYFVMSFPYFIKVDQYYFSFLSDFFSVISIKRNRSSEKFITMLSVLHSESI